MCKIIRLNKSPIIRPIRIREILRRIMGKTVILTIKKDEDVAQAARSLQVCAHQEAGAESSEHSMIDLLECDESTSLV